MEQVCRSIFYLSTLAVILAFGCTDHVNPDPPASIDLDGDTDSDSDGDSDSDSDADGDSDADTDPPTDCTLNEHCYDNNSCTVDYCNQEEFECVYAPVLGNPPCEDDGLVCTGVERCIDGVCSHVDPITCPAIVEGDTDTGAAAGCRIITESVCDETTGGCVDTVETAPDGTPCSETLFCIGDKTRVCNEGNCIVPADGASPCAAETDCLFETCLEETDVCSPEFLNENGSCSTADGFCSTNDTCICEAGACNMP